MAVFLVLLVGPTAAAQDLSTLYQAKAIVTGTGEQNRQIGFRLCLEQAIMRISGN